MIKERKSVGSGKSSFCNWIEIHDDMNASKTPIDGVPGAMVQDIYAKGRARPSIVLFDALTRLKGMSAGDKLAGWLVEDARSGIEGKLNKACVKTFVCLVDKPNYMPVAKGAEQADRKKQAAGLSKRAEVGLLAIECRELAKKQLRPLDFELPQGLTCHEALCRGLITNDQADRYRLWHDKLDEIAMEFSSDKHNIAAARHLEKEQERASGFIFNQRNLNLLDLESIESVIDAAGDNTTSWTDIEYALDIVGRTLLPQPWNEIMSIYRSHVIRYLVKALLFDPAHFISVPERKRLIFDGHSISPDHIRYTDPDALKKPKRDSAKETVPLCFCHPKDHGVPRTNGWEIFGFVQHSESEPCEDSEERSYSSVYYDEDYKNTVGEADSAMFFYIRKLMEELYAGDGQDVVEVITTDTDFFRDSLFFLYKWQKGLLGPKLVRRRLPQIYFTRGTGWVNPHLGGSVDVTACYRRIVGLWLHGDIDRIPSFVGAICCSGGDYTIGYYELPCLRFVENFLKFQVRIVIKGNEEFETPILTNMVRYVPLTDAVDPDDPTRVAVTEVINGSAKKTGELVLYLDPYAYVDLVLFCYYVKHQTHIQKHKTMAIENPTHAPLSLVHMQELINPKVIPDDMKYYAESPLRNPVHIDDLEKLLKAESKQIPPVEEIRERALSTFNVLSMIAQNGNDRIIERDLLEFGFRKIREDEPLSSRNIRFASSFDHKNRRAIWAEQQLMGL